MVFSVAVYKDRRIAIAVIKGISKATNSHMNGFLKTAATISKKSAKNCLSQGFLVTCWSGLQRLQKPFMTPLVAFGKLAKSVLILIEAFTNLY